MFTTGWFDWIEYYPLWLQLVIGTAIGLACMFVIVFSFIGIGKIHEWFKKKIDELEND